MKMDMRDYEERVIGKIQKELDMKDRIAGFSILIIGCILFIIDILCFNICSVGYKGLFMIIGFVLYFMTTIFILKVRDHGCINDSDYLGSFIGTSFVFGWVWLLYYVPIMVDCVTTIEESFNLWVLVGGLGVFVAISLMAMFYFLSWEDRDAEDFLKDKENFDKLSKNLRDEYDRVFAPTECKCYFCNLSKTCANNREKELREDALAKKEMANE